MYLVVENPDIVDTLGGIQKPEPHEGDEVPPKPIQEGVKLVNSILVRRVCIDDPTKALYKRMDEGSEFFYERNDPLSHSLSEVKILYVFRQEGFMPEPKTSRLCGQVQKRVDTSSKRGCERLYLQGDTNPLVGKRK